MRSPKGKAEHGKHWGRWAPGPLPLARPSSPSRAHTLRLPDGVSPSGGQRQRDRKEEGKAAAQRSLSCLRGSPAEPAVSAAALSLRACSGLWGGVGAGSQLSLQAEALNSLFLEDPDPQFLFPPLSCRPSPPPLLLLISDVSRQGRPFLPGEGSVLGNQRRASAWGCPGQGQTDTAL